MFFDPAFLKQAEATLPNAPNTGQAIAWPAIGGTIYQFYTAGDILARHTHPEGQNHITVVVSGSIAFTTYNADGSSANTQYDTPAFIVVPPNVDHSITGIVDNTLVYNIAMKGIDPSTLAAEITALGPTIDILTGKVTALKALTV
jgi:hypothetical protein